MQFAYGNYTHADNEVELQSITRQMVVDATGRAQSIKHQWKVRGVLQAASQAALDSALSNLEDAYAENGHSAVLKLNSGANSVHVLDSSQTVGGVKVVGGVDYPVGDGTEFVTSRTYAITLEAEFPFAPAGRIIKWQESIRFSGGGPKFVWLETSRGKPVKQKTQEQTLYRAVQSGSAVGYLQRLPPPGALAPQLLITPPEIEYGNPQRNGNTLHSYPTKWTYRMADAAPIVALPRPPA